LWVDFLRNLNKNRERIFHASISLGIKIIFNLEDSSNLNGCVFHL